MARKKKRSCQERSMERVIKRPRSCANRPSNGGLVKQVLLFQYYPEVLTLREYLLARLPAASKIRRKKILAIERRTHEDTVDEVELDNNRLAAFLDQTLIGAHVENSPNVERWKEWASFSQRADNSELTDRSLDGVGDCSQSEIVDFTIWQLFKQSSRSGTRLQHLLCQGFRKDVERDAVKRDENPLTAIPGLVSTYPNHYVSKLKEHPWPQILALMGKDGQRMMINLILDCGIFVLVESGHGNYLQMSGLPLGDLHVLPESAIVINQNESVVRPGGALTFKGEHLQSPPDICSPARIRFVRNRIMYARAALNTQGNVRYGLRHTHVLNRYRCETQTCNRKDAQKIVREKDDVADKASNRNHQNAIHIMMYIFPRQFALHNVFTSSVDPQETVQPLKDYALREDEIASIYGRTSNPNRGARVRLPKRLRGKALGLVKTLSVSHKRCSYDKLLNHYCPAPGPYPISSIMPPQETMRDESTTFDTQNNCQTPNVNQDSIASSSATKKMPYRNPTLMDYATPLADVSAFCRSSLSVLVPNQFWGEDEIQKHNKVLFFKFVDRFINLRRFETASLHDAIQGMKIQSISWLRQQHSGDKRTSQSDSRKRLEIFFEFVYYLIDSLLIPLIRSHFFVTESNIHRYRLFFFRQDVWRSICEPQLACLKQTMLEEINVKEAEKILDSRTLGFSQLRLLPKETGVRPIMNLKRRNLRRGHKKWLGSSINSILAPVYNMYTYEKTSNPNRIGATIFSVGDLYSRLKNFSKEMANCGKPLFFVKVDVQSAFDTIPQSAVLKLMHGLPSESEYRISKFAEIKPAEHHDTGLGNQTRSKPIRKWTSLAASPGDFQSFEDNLESKLAIGKKNTVFVENVVSHFRDRDELLEILSQHIQYNMVKIGKKFYRQKTGIPQGSVLSSILCNYFYADLESSHLRFLDNPGSLLLRLVDDFLLITTEAQHAVKFLQVMHDGLPDYGVTVNAAKTLVNFEVSINGIKVSRLIGGHDFPYCGNFIDTKTLHVTKDRGRKKHMDIADSLTVEFSRTLGKMFEKKVLNAFKLQSHAIFLDTSFNSLRTVFANIYDSFVETATKMWRYAKCLPVSKQPRTGVVIRTIQSLVDLAFILMKSKGQNKKYEGYQCGVSRIQVEWLALTAFRFVLRSKQAKYVHVLAWLESRIQAVRLKKGKAHKHLMEVISTRALTRASVG